MGYGDFQFFDLIIFAGVAAFLVFRLRKVLGKRTGFEKKQKDNPMPTEHIIKDKKREIYIPDLEEGFAEL